MDKEIMYLKVSGSSQAPKVAGSIVKNIDAKPIIKQTAYSGYIEFRFAIEVQ